MRGRILTIAIVLVLLAGLSAAEQIAVTRMTKAALSATQEIGRAVHDSRMDDAKDKTHALDEAWDRQAGFLELIVDHGTTDDVRYALSRLFAALEGEARAEALIYVGELEGAIEHVLDRQAISLQNLL